MMDKIQYKKIGLLFFFLLIILSVYIFGTEPSLTRIKNGWIYSGPILNSIPYPLTRPIICDQSVVILEQYKKPSLRQFLQHDYYMTASSIEDGDIVSRTKLRYENLPLQVNGMWSWNNNVVILGHYQFTSGLDTRNTHLLILDIKGNIISQFGLKTGVKPMAIDQKNNFLLCCYKFPELFLETQSIDSNSVDLNTYAYIYALPSGKLLSMKRCDDLFDIVSDTDGNAYLFKRTTIDAEKGFYGAILEKYSIEPWQQLWSISLEGQGRKYPMTASFYKGLIWYALRNNKGGTYVEDKIEWTDTPIDPNTGKFVEVDYQYHPLKIETEIKGKKYLITTTTKHDGQNQDLVVKVLDE